MGAAATSVPAEFRSKRDADGGTTATLERTAAPVTPEPAQAMGKISDEGRELLAASVVASSGAPLLCVDSNDGDVIVELMKWEDRFTTLKV